MRMNKFPYLGKAFVKLDGLFICQPERAKLRRLLTIGMIWLYIWICNIFFGANTALSVAEEIHSSSMILSVVPEPILAFFLVLFFPIAGIKFAVIPIIVIILVFMSGARYLHFLYKFPSIRVALKYLTSVTFGWFYPRISIDDRFNLPDEDSRNWLTYKGGPGYLFVQPGLAVVLERLDAPSRILSAGNHYITRFERLVDVVDLKDQLIEIQEERAMTKDRFEISVKGVYFRYRINSTARSEVKSAQINMEPYPFSIASVRNLHYNRPISKDGPMKWEKMVQDSVVNEITSFINENNFATLTMFDPSGNDTREMMAKRIRSPEFRNKLRNIGTKLVWFDVGNFGLPEEFESEKVINPWQATWMNKTATTKAIGDAQRISLQEIGKAEAQAEILRKIVDILNSMDYSDDYSEINRSMVISKLAQLFGPTTLTEGEIQISNNPPEDNR
jgi:hypothetical protein